MNHELTLPADLEAFVGRLIADGRFSTLQSAVVAALEEYAARDRAIDALVSGAGLSRAQLRADLEDAWSASQSPVNIVRVYHSARDLEGRL